MNNKLKQWHYGLFAALLTTCSPQTTSAQTTNFEYVGTEAFPGRIASILFCVV